MTGSNTISFCYHEVILLLMMDKETYANMLDSLTDMSTRLN